MMMADDRIPKDEWQPLLETGGQPSPDPLEAEQEEVAKSTPELRNDSRESGLTEKDGWQSLQARGADPFLDNLEAKEEDVRNAFPEMVDDSQETYTDEQRQSLHEKINGMSAPEKLRLAIFANREVRSMLIHDPKKIISLAVLKNARMNESEVLQYAQRKDLSEEVISTIAKEQKWRRHYPIKFAVVANPKTPIPAALNLLPQLHERDLKALSRDKNVAPILRRRAHELCAPKNGK
jgi:hypothetical protein